MDKNKGSRRYAWDDIRRRGEDDKKVTIMVVCILCEREGEGVKHCN